MMIGPFEGKYDWLSNFYITDIEYDGIIYKSSEHAFQAAKSSDKEVREWVGQANTPAEAKKRGRKVVKRDDWEDIRIEVMEEILINKFSKRPLRQKLRQTGDEELVEVNWWGDKFWGVCRGVGENNLGKLLMKIRNLIKDGGDVVVAVTGHRPKIFGTYNENSKNILEVKKNIRKFLSIQKRHIQHLITGGALGVDMWSSEIALELEIPLMVAIPFKGQNKTWPKESQERHLNIIKKTSKIYVINTNEDISMTFEEYLKLPAKTATFSVLSRWFDERNKWMVDRCDVVMAVWNGEHSGTGNCVKYAKSKGKKIYNLWKDEYVNG